MKRVAERPRPNGLRNSQLMGLNFGRIPPRFGSKADWLPGRGYPKQVTLLTPRSSLRPAALGGS